MNASPSEYDARRQMILEGNIARLIAAAGRLPQAAAASRLESVLAEVRRHRRSRLRRRALVAAVTSIAAAAAVLVAAVFIQRSAVRPEIGAVRPPATRPELASAVTEVATVKAISGLASLTDGGKPLALAGRESVASGDWLKTAWGSRAEVLLADQSQMVVQPHTRLQINSRRGGRDILLDEGQISLDVVKQPRNKTVTISTPDARVTVVGTALDVQVLTKSDGRKQTWVDVRSGRVELASGGKRVVLLPNMQGIATPGRAADCPFPNRRSERVGPIGRADNCLGGQGGDSARSARRSSSSAAMVRRRFGP